MSEVVEITEAEAEPTNLLRRLEVAAVLVDEVAVDARVLTRAEAAPRLEHVVLWRLLAPPQQLHLVVPVAGGAGRGIRGHVIGGAPSVQLHRVALVGACRHFRIHTCVANFCSHSQLPHGPHTQTFSNA